MSSTALVAATYKRFGKAADGTSTQVATYIINKLRAKINREEVYNVTNPPEIGDQKNRLREDGCCLYDPRKLL